MSVSSVSSNEIKSWAVDSVVAGYSMWSSSKTGADVDAKVETSALVCCSVCCIGSPLVMVVLLADEVAASACLTASSSASSTS